MFFGSRIKEIDAAELKQWQANKTGQFRILDVRTPQETAVGIIPGAELMPLTTVPLRINELDRQQPLVFVCRSGNRSAQVCMFLQQQGFEKVYNLRGGMIAWANAGGGVAAMPHGDGANTNRP